MATSTTGRGPGQAGGRRTRAVLHRRSRAAAALPVATSAVALLAFVAPGASAGAAHSGSADAVRTQSASLVRPRTATTVSLRVVSGNRAVSAAWSGVPGATRYTVDVSTTRTLSRPRTVTLGSTARDTTVTGLAPRTQYYLRVTATTPAGPVRSPVTAARTTSPTAMPVGVTGVTAVPAGKDRIRVSWTGGAQTVKVAVLAGSDSLVSTHSFHTGWMPATRQPVTVTVPAALRAMLGGGSGGAVFVRVAQSNAVAPGAMPPAYDPSRQYRLTPTGVYSIAGFPVPPAPQDRLTVASWNVQSLPATQEFSPGNRWDQRMPRVVANVEQAAPALIGFQELGTSVDPVACPVYAACLTQYEQLAAALLDRPVRYVNVRPDARAYRLMVLRDSGYIDSMLFYDPARLTPLASGFWRSTYGGPVGTWAELEVKASGRRFLASSIHFPIGSTAELARQRTASAGELVRFLDGKAATLEPGVVLPVVQIGDFNAFAPYDLRHPTWAVAPSLVYRAAGYVDAAATVHRTGMMWSTANLMNGTGGTDPGYPVTAVIHPHPTSRIDYILVKGSPYSYGYANLARVVDGRFVRSLQGSDHNLQLATIGITDPAPVP